MVYGRRKSRLGRNIICAYLLQFFLRVSFRAFHNESVDDFLCIFLMEKIKG